MKILVSYSSGYGATREIAEEIARTIVITDRFQVDVRNIDDCEVIDEYDGIIVGTSIRADRPLANARDFFSAHRFQLSEKMVALFVVSITASTAGGAQIAKRDFVTQLIANYPRINPLSVEAFPGKVDLDKLNPVMQNLVKNVMKKKGLTRLESFDARNWDQIRAWAREVVELFLVTVNVVA